jgi:hypothetical protein
MMAVSSNSTALPARKSMGLHDLLRSADRRRMEAAIEALIAALDALDGDPDFEPANDDEPSLGWRGEGRGCRAGEGTDDREFEDEREISAIERHGAGFIWSGRDDDDEDTHDAEYCVGDHYGIADRDGALEQGFGGAWQAAI